MIIRDNVENLMEFQKFLGTRYMTQTEYIVYVKRIAQTNNIHICAIYHAPSVPNIETWYEYRFAPRIKYSLFYRLSQVGNIGRLGSSSYNILCCLAGSFIVPTLLRRFAYFAGILYFAVDRPLLRWQIRSDQPYAT